MDIINQTWNPQCDLVMVFDLFLPQLLLQPNTSDPLNEEAACLLLNDPVKFKVILALLRKWLSLPSRSTLLTPTERAILKARPKKRISPSGEVLT